ncbi:MAG: beta-ribofuranosylaminobenzene 5'-phosphate synthase family protein [Steroidobacteraceae bacterium]
MTSKTLWLRTTSRLAFGLIDLNGEIGRVEGGLGLAIDDPCVQLRARRAEGVSFGGPVSLSAGTRRKFEAMCQVFREKHGTQGIELTLEQTIPDHSGLGSGTQLALAFGWAFNLLYDLKLGLHEVERIAQRGGTSGIGCAAFETGGFLCDGGHRYQRAGGKTVFAPSGASTEFAAPPILFHRNLPPSWKVLLAIPKEGRQVHGDEERELFLKLTPIPSEEAAQSARLALLKVLPAVMEDDLEGFGEGLEAMQRLGWKKIQISRQNAAVHATLAEMRRLGLKAVGMSSWGPTLFGFSDAGDEEFNKVARALEHFGQSLGGIRVIPTKPATHGTTWGWE